MKSCKSCGELKAPECFRVDSKSKDGRGNKCKACINARTVAERTAHPEMYREITVRVYGITLAEYSELLLAQGGVCAVCLQPETQLMNGAVKALCVDHDHACCPSKRSCGKCIRGLLCHFCNMAAGFLRDNPATAIAMADYLGRIGQDAP